MKYALLLLILVTFNGVCQDHLEKYLTHVGLNRVYPENSNRINFNDLLVKSGGLTADQVMSKIISENPNGAFIYFTAGVYHFDKIIKLPSNYELQGESTKSTQLVFQLEEKSDAILAMGRRSIKEISLKLTPKMGDSVLFFPDSNIQADDWIILRDDDSKLVTSSWAMGKTGQIVQVKEVNDNRIVLNGYIKRDYSGVVVSNKLQMVENVKLTNLSIVNNTQTDHQSSNIHFSYANNCLVNGVSSTYSNYAHILFEFSANCEVQNSKFQLAHDYGNGGKGYGVVLQFATGECLIKENIFKTLRHGIVLQAGASGNKIESNYSTNPYWEGVFLPKHSAGDIVLHGNYPYLNLITQNTCQNLVIDNSHGLNGPNNVIRMNLIERYGLVMNKNSANAPLYFIQNKITGKGVFKGKFRIKGKGHILQENTVKGKIKD